MTAETQTTESEYRVILGQDGAFDLFDLDDSTPVIVLSDDAEYEDASICETMANLKPGNRITANLQSTGEIRDTGLFKSPVYRFDTVELLDESRSYHGFGDLPVVGSAKNLVSRLTKDGAGIGRKKITEDGRVIGRIVAFNREHPSPAEPIFEEELQSLTEIGESPFHVFQTATDDGRFFVHYYLTTTDSPLGEALLARVNDDPSF